MRVLRTGRPALLWLHSGHPDTGYTERDDRHGPYATVRRTLSFEGLDEYEMRLRQKPTGSNRATPPSRSRAELPTFR